jgi:serine phosphatase RsbU (regulator of sigma subunit)/anti-sigma regulatory factor (Ser/Thr protein kinase)
MHVSSNRLDAFTEADLELLEPAAERVALAFERTMVYEREHEIAVTLQRSVLPGELPDLGRLDLAARYFPGRSELEVGGDWYDVIPLDDHRVGFAIGDVVGKGVLAASAMAQLRNALRVYALEGLKPSSVLTRLSELAKSTGTPFATVIYLVIDWERGTCRYASAGHPPPLLLRRGWHATYLEGGRSTPVGAGLDSRYRQASADIGPGDVILLYTDGLVESRTLPLGEGMDRLCDAVESAPEDLDELLDHVAEELSVDTRQDDVAIVALRLQPVGSLSLRLATQPSSLARMRRELRVWLDEVGIDEADAHEILLACSEACSNAIKHAPEDPAPEFEVRGTRENGEIALVVRDFGRWREPGVTDERGFGLQLMKALMDTVSVASTDDGTEVHLRRRVAHVPA